MEEGPKNPLAIINVNTLICTDQEKRFSIKTNKTKLSAKCVFGLVWWGFLSCIAFVVAFYLIAAVVGVISWDKETGLTWGVVAFLLVPIGIAYGFGKPLVQEWKRRRAEQRRLEGECRYLSALLRDSQGKFDELEGITRRAFLSVSDAKRDWEDKVYGTFWDSVEEAADRFREYEDNIKFIEESASDYKGRVAQHALSVPNFELRIEGFPDIRNSVMILAGIVREAQKDFQMVTLYEQRKTNRLLKEGFSNVASAIRSMEQVLSRKIDSLSDTLGKKLDRMAAISLAQNAQLASINSNIKNMKVEVDVGVDVRSR